jgi:HK97 gp10 family phage protein
MRWADAPSWRAATARALDVYGEVTRAEMYGLLERNKVGRGRVYIARGARKGEKADFFALGPYGLFPAKMRTKPHYASAPGDPPARDTGKLMESIAILKRAKPDDLSTEVGPRTESFRGIEYYAKYLEYGTRGMAPRPFVKPTADAVRKLLRGGSVTIAAPDRMRLAGDD